MTAEPPGSRSLLATILFSFGPTILLVALFIFPSGARGGRRAAGIGQFGRSRARRVRGRDRATVTFDDVAGIDEAEDELVEVVDFLRNPRSTEARGARIPQGVLLVGRPGRARRCSRAPWRARPACRSSRIRARSSSR